MRWVSSRRKARRAQARGAPCASGPELGFPPATALLQAPLVLLDTPAQGPQPGARARTRAPGVWGPRLCTRCVAPRPHDPHPRGRAQAPPPLEGASAAYQRSKSTPGEAKPRWGAGCRRSWQRTLVVRSSGALSSSPYASGPPAPALAASAWWQRARVGVVSQPRSGREAGRSPTPGSPPTTACSAPWLLSAYSGLNLLTPTNCVTASIISISINDE
jgi:hypothetical protein